ncbi:MAG TPA: hypothetical protein VMA09_18325 [Candidatus Binataceae bacterium]|nr:hypothetical protein [Candidatus Binataceae bacterium]
MAAIVMIVLAGTALAEHYTRDDASSQALTKHLHKHRLPMVGAQVLDGDDGSRQVILYGFVATDQGRYHAEQRARAYLGTQEITVDNRIVVDSHVRKEQPEPPPDYMTFSPFATPSPPTSIFSARTPIARFPTPIPTIAPNLFVP